MDIVVSIGMGILIVWLALYLIKKEVMKASFFKNVQKQSSSLSINDDVIGQVQRLEQVVDEMNQSFYDIVSDLEGHYSLHEKEIDIINTRMDELSNGLDDLSRSIYYQSKELQTFSKKSEEMQSVEANNDEIKTIKSTKTKANSTYQEVNRLKALGYDEQQIAKRMDKGIREIKMLLNLKK